jgi:hypothetical protein
MDEVTVRVSELRERVQSNRDEHRNVFDKAVAIYRERLLDHLEQKIADVKAGRKIDHAIRLPVPEDHTKDYDRVILMLDMHTEPSIKIDQRLFAMYVMDDWAWRESFAASTASYLAE